MKIKKLFITSKKLFSSRATQIFIFAPSPLFFFLSAIAFEYDQMFMKVCESSIN